MKQDWRRRGADHRVAVDGRVISLSPNAAGVPRWYVTAHTVRSGLRDGVVVERPSSTAHAKRMGTLTAACGAWVDSWPKLLDVPFPLPPGEAGQAPTCKRCLDVVLEEWS